MKSHPIAVGGWERKRRIGGSTELERGFIKIAGDIFAEAGPRRQSEEKKGDAGFLMKLVRRN